MSCLAHEKKGTEDIDPLNFLSLTLITGSSENYLTRVICLEITWSFATRR